MFKLSMMILFQIGIAIGLYYFNNIWFIYISQFIFSICLVLTDNAVSINYQNIHALNANIEKLIEHISVFQKRKRNENLNEEWFDISDENNQNE